MTKKSNEVVFVSDYKKLGFYVGKEYKKFKSGRYVAKTEDEIKVLEKCSMCKKEEKKKEG